MFFRLTDSLPLPQYPMPMDMKSKANKKAADELCKDPNIRKIAHHGSSKSPLSRPFL